MGSCSTGSVTESVRAVKRIRGWFGRVILDRRVEPAVAGLSPFFFLVVKVSPDAVTIPERKDWKNRCLASGIVTQLLLALFNFLGRRAPRAKEKLRLMEQCF
jgi:hypothetical protein